MRKERVREMSDIDISQLPIIIEFLRIHREEGSEAAVKWAEAQELKLGVSESSDKEPSLKIVR